MGHGLARYSGWNLLLYVRWLSLEAVVGVGEVLWRVPPRGKYYMRGLGRWPGELSGCSLEEIAFVFYRRNCIRFLSTPYQITTNNTNVLSYSSVGKSDNWSHWTKIKVPAGPNSFLDALGKILLLCLYWLLRPVASLFFFFFL